MVPDCSFFSSMPTQKYPWSASFMAVESSPFLGDVLGQRSQVVDVLIEPVQDRLQRLAIVLFAHHQVAVAVDAEVGQPDFFGVNSRLLQEGDRAGIRKHERRLGGVDTNRAVSPVLELVRRFFLDVIGLDAQLGVGLGGLDLLGLDLRRDPTPADRIPPAG